MRLDGLKTSPGARHRSKRVGRGRASGVGKTSGRGGKGQMARKGHKHKLGFEGGQMPLIRRIPKRGFKNALRREYRGVNVSLLERFEDGSEVNPAALAERGLVRGRDTAVKILGGGELNRKLAVKAHAFTRGARAKIEAAGGVCEVIEA